MNDLGACSTDWHHQPSQSIEIRDLCSAEYCRLICFDHQLSIYSCTAHKVGCCFFLIVSRVYMYASTLSNISFMMLSSNEVYLLRYSIFRPKYIFVVSTFYKLHSYTQLSTSIEVTFCLKYLLFTSTLETVTKSFIFDNIEFHVLPFQISSPIFSCLGSCIFSPACLAYVCAWQWSMFCGMSAAATTLRFDGSQYFRVSVSEVCRDVTTYNMSVRIRTRRSNCHLMTFTSSVNDAQLRLFLDRGHVTLAISTLAQTQSSRPYVVSVIILL